MSLYKYMDDTYSAATCDNGKNYSIHKDGVAAAAIFWVKAVRTFYFFAYIPGLLFKFLSFKAGFTEAPVNPVEEAKKRFLERAQQVAADAAKAKADESTPSDGQDQPATA